MGVGRPHLVEKAGRVRLLDVEVLPFDDELHRLGLPDRAREPLRASGPREDAERHLRQADLERAGPGDAEVARERDLEPAADRVAVDRGEDELGRVLEPEERLIGV